MIWWAFNGLTVLSLLVFVAVVVLLWIRSERVHDDLTYFERAGKEQKKCYTYEAVVGVFALHIETITFPPSR